MKTAVKQKTEQFSPIRIPALPRASEEMSETISIRITPKLKANIERRLKEMGVPERRFADFYRGAIKAGVGNAMFAQDPAYQKFLQRIHPIAMEMLGMEFMDSGMAGILEEGEISTSSGA